MRALLNVGRAAGLAALPVLDLVARLGVGKSFFVSGMLKAGNWPVALELARFEYPLPGIDPTTEAVAGFLVELIGSVLLMAGFLTRPAAAAMLVLALTSQVAYRQVDTNLFWIAVLAWQAVRGPGAISINSAIAADCATARPRSPRRRCVSARGCRSGSVRRSIWRFGSGSRQVSRACLPRRVCDGDLGLRPIGFPTGGGVPACGRFRDAARRGRSRTVDIGGLGVDECGGVAILRRSDLRASGRRGRRAAVARRGGPPIRRAGRAPARSAAAGRDRGAGFAGVSCVQGLREEGADITLIDRNNYHLFQPLLYQVATAGLSPADFAAPVRAMFRDDPAIQCFGGPSPASTPRRAA